MTTKATRKGASRLDVMEEIAKKNLEETIKDIENDGGDAAEFKALRNDEPAAEDEDEHQAPAQDEAQDEPPEVEALQKQVQEDLASPSAKVRAIIDGEEKLVTVDEVLRAYQKNQAADKRLAEATRLMREAEEARKRATTVTEVAKAEQDVSDTKAAMKSAMQENVKKFAGLLLDGEVDNAVASLTAAFDEVVDKAFEGRGNATPDIDALATEVRKKNSVEEALSQGKRDYPSIFADQDLAELADKHVYRLMTDAEQPLDEAAAIIRACDTIAAKLKLDKYADAGRPDPSTTRRTEKADRKQSIATIPSAGARAATQPQSDPESSEARSGAILELMKARGQA